MDNNIDTIKIVHLIWLGEKPMYDKYIDSIKTFLPDFEIKIWRDKECMNYITECEYAKKHYLLKDYCFVSDYCRFRILYDFGGVYIDTDVEFVRGIDDLIKKGSFLATEDIFSRVGSGHIMYFNHTNAECLKCCIDIYRQYPGYEILIDGEVLAFSIKKYDYKRIDENQILTNGITVYDSSYFNGVSTDNPNTRSIHHYTRFWQK